MANQEHSTATRRTILTGTAAALVAGTAVNAVALTDRFADMEKRWRVLFANCQTSPAEAITDAVEAALPPPEALRHLPSDLDFVFRPPVCGRSHYEAPCDFEQFKPVQLRGQALETLKAADGIGRQTVTLRMVGEPWPEKQARADEIMAAYEPWADAVAEMYEKLGLKEAEDLFSERCAACGRLEEEIAKTPAASLAELRTKAKLLLKIHESYNDDFDEPIGQSAFGLVEDIKRLVKA